VGNAYAVSPSAALRARAEKEGWPVLPWKEDYKDGKKAAEATAGGAGGAVNAAGGGGSGQPSAGDPVAA
jgi:hypothetical protein